MGRGGGGGPRDRTAKSGALITNPGQLRKNVQRAMRKLLDKKLISVRSSLLHGGSDSRETRAATSNAAPRRAVSDPAADLVRRMPRRWSGGRLTLPGRWSTGAHSTQVGPCRMNE